MFTEEINVELVGPGFDHQEDFMWQFDQTELKKMKVKFYFPKGYHGLAKLKDGELYPLENATVYASSQFKKPFELYIVSKNNQLKKSYFVGYGPLLLKSRNYDNVTKRVGVNGSITLSVSGWKQFINKFGKYTDTEREDSIKNIFRTKGNEQLQNVCESYANDKEYSDSFMFAGGNSPLINKMKKDMQKNINRELDDLGLEVVDINLFVTELEESDDKTQELEQAEHEARLREIAKKGREEPKKAEEKKPEPQKQEEEDPIEFCFNCGKRLKGKEKRCGHCGEDILNPSRKKINYCPSCGNKIKKETNNCPDCGYKLRG